jgi:hypothetical protein
MLENLQTLGQIGLGFLAEQEKLKLPGGYLWRQRIFLSILQKMYPYHNK